MTKCKRVYFGWVIGLALPAAALAQTDPNLGRLEREIARLERSSGGRMGVAAVHLETGRSVFLNRSERFPMASSYKVPIAVQLLHRVDRGELRLDSMIALQPGDLHPGSGTLTELFDDPGVILSLRNYLELMLLISDNSATDVVLRTAGGGSAVTQRMRALGIEGINVDRPTVGLIADFAGWRLAVDSQQVPQAWRAAAMRTTRTQGDSANRAFNKDTRDTSSPEGMAQLLQKIWRREALSAQSSALLLDIMTRSTTGPLRIKGMLPPDVRVTHKTGTIGETTNDVGIIALPDNAGNVITVVFVKESTLPVETRERAIAQISRAIYDYFLFNPGA
ncbi:MAG: class A beta-lactamase [Longimicrobiales bacterium]